MASYLIAYLRSQQFKEMLWLFLTQLILFKFRNPSNSNSRSVWQAWTPSWDWPSFSWVIWCRWAEVRKFLNLFEVTTRVFKKYGWVLAINVFYQSCKKRNNNEDGKNRGVVFNWNELKFQYFTRYFTRCGAVYRPTLEILMSFFLQNTCCICRSFLSSIKIQLYSICNRRKGLGRLWSP